MKVLLKDTQSYTTCENMLVIYRNDVDLLSVISRLGTKEAIDIIPGSEKLLRRTMNIRQDIWELYVALLEAVESYMRADSNNWDSIQTWIYERSQIQIYEELSVL